MSHKDSYPLPHIDVNGVFLKVFQRGVGSMIRLILLFFSNLGYNKETNCILSGENVLVLLLYAYLNHRCIYS